MCQYSQKKKKKGGPPRVQTSGFIEKKYWSKAECRSRFINSPFWTELIFDMPVVSFIFVIHLEYPNWFQRFSLSRGNTWAASSFVHTPELASKPPPPDIMHFLSRSQIPSWKALSRPEILYVRKSHSSSVTLIASRLKVSDNVELTWGSYLCWWSHNLLEELDHCWVSWYLQYFATWSRNYQ